ncbi:MAG: hypothetical protein ACI8T1_002465 [Verrucomicrobiales bacterium]
MLEAVDVTLQAPSIALSRATFHPIDHLTVTVTLTNPNPASVSEVIYSVDDGTTWEPYSDAFDINLLDHLDGATVITHATLTAHPANVVSSADVSQTIGVDKANLVVPTIASSAPMLNPQGYPTTTITLTNPNNSAFSKIAYSLDNEETWVDYADPFDLSVTDYPEGVTILARSEPTALPDLIIVSGNALTTLPVPPKLDMVTFSREAGRYVKSQFESGISISNPNGSSDSTIKFRVDGGAWIDYTLPFVLTQWSATVEAYAVASDYAQFQDSDKTSPVYERIFLTPNLAFEMDASGLPNLVHEFTGEAYGSFKDPLGASNLTYTIDNNYFEWRVSTGYLGFDNGNWLDYTGASWDGVQAGELFRLGTLDYFNGSVWLDTTATDVTMELTIALSLPDTTETFDIHLDLESTQN